MATTSQQSLFGDLYNLATIEKSQADKDAYDIAQLAPGRAAVYGASKAGGMLGRGMGKAMGFTTSDQQRKQILVQEVLSQYKDEDPTSAKTQLAMGQEFINRGLPNIGQQLVDKSQATAVTVAQFNQTQQQLDTQFINAQTNIRNAKATEDRYAFEKKQYEDNTAKREADLNYTVQLTNTSLSSQEAYQATTDLEKLKMGMLESGALPPLDYAQANTMNDDNFSAYKAIFKNTDNITGETWVMHDAYKGTGTGQFEKTPTYEDYLLAKSKGNKGTLMWQAYETATGLNPSYLANSPGGDNKDKDKDKDTGPYSGAIWKGLVLDVAGQMITPNQFYSMMKTQYPDATDAYIDGKLQDAREEHMQNIMAEERARLQGN